MSISNIKQEIDEAVPGLPKTGLLPDPSEVPQMIANLGLRAARGSYRTFDEEGKLVGCCALGAAFMTRTSGGHARGLNPHASFLYSDLGISGNFHDGVSNGFDGESRILEFYPPDYAEGLDYGQAAWRACEAAGLTGDLQSYDAGEA